MTRVALIAKPGATHTGVGRYVATLAQGVRDLGLDVRQAAPVLPPLPGAAWGLLRRAGIDARSFLLNYPLWASYPAADVYHLTSQNLASVLCFRRPRRPVVVTVHDIIPYLLRNDPALSPYRNRGDRLFDRLAMSGLRRADRLVADSEYTRQRLVDYLHIPQERIEVVHLGVDPDRFRPLPVSSDIYARYGLRAGVRYLIYAGSEDARKNLPALVKALAVVRGDRGDVELLKVGRAHHAAGRQELIALSEQLGVRSAVHFLDDVPEADLPLLYGLAAVCVMPSLYEGFGFPVLEAMACGTPVICANATSLPELAGDAAIVVDGGAGFAERLAQELGRLLRDPELAGELRARGLARAARFRWSETAGRMARLYGELGAKAGGATGIEGILSGGILSGVPSAVWAERSRRGPEHFDPVRRTPGGSE